MKYGRSLSLCVRDYLDGNVKFDDIGKIITSTEYEEWDEWKGLIELYQKIYWYHYDLKTCEDAVFEFLNSDKIYQPRLEGAKQCENQFIWFDTLEEAMEGIIW